MPASKVMLALALPVHVANHASGVTVHVKVCARVQCVSTNTGRCGERALRAVTATRAGGCWRRARRRAADGDPINLEIQVARRGCHTRGRLPVLGPAARGQIETLKYVNPMLHAGTATRAGGCWRGTRRRAAERIPLKP